MKFDFVFHGPFEVQTKLGDWLPFNKARAAVMQDGALWITESSVDPKAIDLFPSGEWKRVKAAPSPEDPRK